MATNKLGGDEAQDVKLATSLILTPLLKKDGVGAIQQAAQSASDLPAALAMVIFQAMGQVKSAIEQRGIPLSSKIWVARGGVLDRVIQEVCQVLASIPPEIPEVEDPEFMQDVKEEVFNLMEQEEGEGDIAPEQEMAGPPSMLAPRGNPMMGGMEGG